MGLFSPYQRKDKASADVEPLPDEAQPQTGRPKKTVPTPSRKEAEAARRQRVRPDLNSKQAKSRDREATREARIQAMETTDKQPGRTLARDFVDSRWTIAEFLMPMLLVTILLTLLGQQIWGTSQDSVAFQIMNVAMIVSYAMLLFTVIETVLNWRRFKMLLRSRFPKEPTKGLLFYFVNRCISVRMLRQPRPVMKRGDKL